MNITVFGGAQPKQGSPAYEEAQLLGSLLAGRGYGVLTGGYYGTMEAVSRGAHEAGGHVIGVTCGEIEDWRGSRANAFVKEERKRQTLADRLMALIKGCDAAIALPGGPGTLTEITLMWNLMIIESLPRKPLILVGRGWRSTFEQFFGEHDAYTPAEHRALLYFAEDVKSAVERVESRE
ncbi:MAG: DNA-binding protein [Chloroflexi bacterium]|nr:LOG family protein [Anaerolineales bacterium]RIK51810.1 MAG: DNA-binding protein [Chloroflexota bacterium]